MKMITATEANRDFSKLLEEVVAGRSIGIAKHGRMVATINPVGRDNGEAEAFKRRRTQQRIVARLADDDH